MGPLAAALLNSTFIQGCELDDFHNVAPIHAASIMLPTLIAATEFEATRPDSAHTVDGASFLLAFLVGLEIGPRAGMAMNGSEILGMGWHCGTVYGHPASSAAASKLFRLDSSRTEDAIGIACTQSSGLMAAQYEGMVKRMQHGFAARNGLFSALLARSGYKGIKKIFERPYGGYLSTFTLGSEHKPRYQEAEVVKDLGTYWHTEVYRTKLYACVGGAHGLIEAIANLQAKYPTRMDDLSALRRVSVRVSKPVLLHCGWVPTERPMTAVGSQMNCAYIAAVQLMERQVLLAQFTTQALDSDDVWHLVPLISCEHDPDLDTPKRGCGAHVRMEFADGEVLEEVVDQPRGFDPPLTNEEIRKKWRELTDGIVDVGRVEAIEKAVLGLEGLGDLRELIGLLEGETRNPLA